MNSRIPFLILFSLLSVVVLESVAAGDLLDPPKGAVSSRAKSYDDWFPFWHDRGGETFAFAVKDRKFLGPKYLPGVKNLDRPGTIAHLNTAAHEGVHAFGDEAKGQEGTKQRDRIFARGK